MLLRDIMKRLRVAFGFLAFLGLMVIDARAQSTYQTLTFSVQSQYEFTTNNIPNQPDVVHETLQLLLFTSANVAKAIAVDEFGNPGWKTWATAVLLRRVNLVTGEDRIYLSKGYGTNAVDVTSYFSGSYVSNFTSGRFAAFPVGMNNFTPNNPDPFQPLYSGTNTTYLTSAGLYFISLNTTNLKMNLLGANFGVPVNGTLHNYKGTQTGTNYSAQVQNEIISVVGTFSWTPNTNIFDIGPVTNTFYSGPAHGTVTVGEPSYSKLALPPAPPD
jgi:hypothetical protein